MPSAAARASHSVADFLPVDPLRLLRIPGLAALWWAELRMYQDTTYATAALANGDLVAGWQDLSGNGFHATQATSTKRLALTTNIIGGRNVLRIGGGDDYLTNTSFTISQPNTAYAVCRFQSAGSGNNLFDGNSSRQVLYTQNGTGKLSMYAGSAEVPAAGAESFPTGGMVLAVVFNGALSQLYKNGVLISSGNPGAVALTSLNIGTFNGSNPSVDGDISLLAFFSGAHSPELVRTISAGLGAYYGIVQNQI